MPWPSSRPWWTWRTCEIPHPGIAPLPASGQPPWTDFWLPDLTPEEAWWLTEFLDELQEAIWMDHGDAISDYLDARSPLDCYHSQEDDDGQ